MLTHITQLVKRRTIWKLWNTKELNTIRSVSKDTLRNDIS